MLHDNMDYTPYEGRRITGWPVVTLSRGERVWNGSEPMGEPGRGRFLECNLPDAAKPQGVFVSGFNPAIGKFSAD